MGKEIAERNCRIAVRDLCVCLGSAQTVGVAREPRLPQEWGS